jgi:hypothetical protein
MSEMNRLPRPDHAEHLSTAILHEIASYLDKIGLEGRGHRKEDIELGARVRELCSQFFSGKQHVFDLLLDELVDMKMRVVEHGVRKIEEKV